MLEGHQRGPLVSIVAEHRLDVVAIRIEHEGGVVVGPAQSRRAVFGPSRLEGGGVECIHLISAFGRERGVLFDGGQIKSIIQKTGYS